MEQYTLKEVSFTHSEVMEYLEEVIQMGMAEEYEEQVYEDIKLGRYKTKQYNRVIHNMKQLYHEKF